MHEYNTSIHKYNRIILFGESISILLQIYAHSKVWVLYVVPLVFLSVSTIHENNPPSLQLFAEGLRLYFYASWPHSRYWLLVNFYLIKG